MNIKCFGFLLTFSQFLTVAEAVAKTAWTTLQNGVEHAVYELKPKSKHGDSKIHVVRVDPAQAKLRFAFAKDNGHQKKTASEWAKQEKFSVVINAGMFGSDHSTNVGYLKSAQSLNNKSWHKKYLSVLAFDPKNKSKSLPPLIWVDRDQTSNLKLFDAYSSAVQNLRLIKGPRKNVWQKQNKEWSEAALGIDSAQRLLFIFSRSPMSMWAFNEWLLASNLDIQQAMHVEGGPEASLSIHTKNLHLDLCGSYETDFMENDSNQHQWPLPNVLGVVQEL